MSNRYRPEEPICPVPLELLALLLRCSDERVIEIVSQMVPLERAKLATYCVARTHLRRVALVIASECSEQSLWQVAGRIGQVLFEQCQDRASFDREPGVSLKRKVSLARAA